jgi:hypothetical protein
MLARLSPPICLTQGYGAGPEAGGGIVITGLLAYSAPLNATYAPTGELVAGFPAYSAGPDKHIFRHPVVDQCRLATKPFDPTVTACWAWILAAGGPVPTGARAWTVNDGAK